MTTKTTAPRLNYTKASDFFSLDSNPSQIATELFFSSLCVYMDKIRDSASYDEWNDYKTEIDCLRHSCRGNKENIRLITDIWGNVQSIIQFYYNPELNNLQICNLLRNPKYNKFSDYTIEGRVSYASIVAIRQVIIEIQKQHNINSVWVESRKSAETYYEKWGFINAKTNYFYEIFHITKERLGEFFRRTNNIIEDDVILNYTS
jgi:hypothetical protein